MNNRLKIKITCNNPNSLLKYLISKNIELHNIIITNTYLELIINKKDYIEISKIKTIKKISIINYYGTSKIEYLIKKNSCFFILFILGIILNLFLSKLIFKIDIETPNKELEKDIKKDLKELGIKKYNFKFSFYEIKNIKEKIKEMNKEKIEWLEIEEKGTRYIVKVQEKKLNKKEDECKNRNIVAKKNAIITKITSSSGEIIKKKNDYVAKGETIISGEIHNKENIVNTKCTKGEIYGETWYRIEIEIPEEYVSKKKTNNKSYGISIKIFNLKKEINQKFSNYEKKTYNIIEGRIIPIEIGFSCYKKIKSLKRVYTIENVDEEALKVAEQEILKNFKNKPTVLRKKVLKKHLNNSKIIIEVFVALEENITDYQEIVAKEELDAWTTNQYNTGSS